MKTRLRWTLLTTFVACCCAGCSESPEKRTIDDTRASSGPVTVYVVNYPLKYFAERIGGDYVNVVFPVPDGRDPMYWIPTSRIISEYQEADLILLNGASYAKWLDMVTLPSSSSVDTSAAVSDQYIMLEGMLTHAHGPGGEHAHGGTASTTWLDPKLASFQAAEIRQALVELRPQHEATFQNNYAALQQDLDDLDEEIAAIVKGRNDRPVIFSHPVYQYLTRRYNLNAKSVHWEPDEVPTPAGWDELASVLDEHAAKWMIWEGEPDPATIKRLEELGLQSIAFEPCGNTPSEGDFLEVMRRNVANLKRVYAAENEGTTKDTKQAKAEG